MDQVAVLEGANCIILVTNAVGQDRKTPTAKVIVNVLVALTIPMTLGRVTFILHIRNILRVQQTDLVADQTGWSSNARLLDVVGVHAAQVLRANEVEGF